MILVTGSTGYVGSAAVSRMRMLGLSVRGLTRNINAEVSNDLAYISSIDENTDWTAALEGVQTVVHCAALVHQMHDDEASRENYYRINKVGSLKLARSCVDAGVRRFVFVSTIKVCGDFTIPGEPFAPNCALLPTDDYSRSKAAAEIELTQIADETGLELVVVRPPLVYGPEAKGNLKLLIKLVARRIPLPLGSIENQRSLVGLDNLADFLVHAATHPKAKGHKFNVSDGKSLSTNDILRILGQKMNRKVALIPIPVPLLRLVARVIGRAGYIDRLSSNLEVDSSNCWSVLNWKPISTAEQSVASLLTDQTVLVESGTDATSVNDVNND